MIALMTIALAFTKSQKKLRRPPQIPQENNKYSFTYNERSSDSSNISSISPSPRRRWWFSRQQQQQHSIQETTTSDTPKTSGMVLSEHLGRTSDVVESLTYDVKNWSLTRLPSPSTIDTTTTTNSNNKTKKKEKHQRCREAQRQVRMAQRRSLEEQQQLVSPCSFATRQCPAPSLTKK
mmetsp:Transcript_5545/g.11443  ORF Transcript_5545/g.11443 Transcript_5545/m.11443 type:complete len:178 (-) Transcript_5545:644-1177(-)